MNESQRGALDNDVVEIRPISVLLNVAKKLSSLFFPTRSI